MTEPRAIVREVDGQLVLDDPDALAMARAVAKHNCRATFAGQAERVAHFVERAKARGNVDSLAIVLVNVDDVHGRHIAELLMPGVDWQPMRDAGQVPFARGLADRAGMWGALALFDEDAAAKLEAFVGLPVIVVDHGVAEVFDAVEAP